MECTHIRRFTLNIWTTGQKINREKILIVFSFLSLRLYYSWQKRVKAQVHHCAVQLCCCCLPVSLMLDAYLLVVQNSVHLSLLVATHFWIDLSREAERRSSTTSCRTTMTIITAAKQIIGNVFHPSGIHQFLSRSWFLPKIQIQYCFPLSYVLLFRWWHWYFHGQIKDFQTTGQRLGEHEHRECCHREWLNLENGLSIWEKLRHNILQPTPNPIYENLSDNLILLLHCFICLMFEPCFSFEMFLQVINQRKKERHIPTKAGEI